MAKSKATAPATKGKASVNKTASTLSADFGKKPLGSDDAEKRKPITPGDVHTPSVNAMKADFAKCKELCGLPDDTSENDVYNTLAGKLTYGMLTVDQLPK